jgi:hypothetical protein
VIPTRSLREPHFLVKSVHACANQHHSRARSTPIVIATNSPHVLPHFPHCPLSVPLATAPTYRLTTATPAMKPLSSFPALVDATRLRSQRWMILSAVNGEVVGKSSRPWQALILRSIRCGTRCLRISPLSFQLFNKSIIQQVFHSTHNFAKWTVHTVVDDLIGSFYRRAMR